MTPNIVRTVAGVVQAVIAFLLVTQTDVALPPLLKVILGAVSVGLAAVDWGSLLGNAGE